MRKQGSNKKGRVIPFVLKILSIWGAVIILFVRALMVY